MSLYIPYVDENVPAFHVYKLVPMFDGKKWSNISYHICNVVNPITCRSPNHIKAPFFGYGWELKPQNGRFVAARVSHFHHLIWPLLSNTHTHTECLIIPDAIESEIVYIHLLSIPVSGRTSAIYAANGMWTNNQWHKTPAACIYDAAAALLGALFMH